MRGRPSRYEAEARYFDSLVREGKQAELQQRLLAELQPVYQAQVAAQQAAILATFDKDLKLAVVEGGGQHGSFTAAAAACREQAMRSFATSFSRHLRIEGEWIWGRGWRREGRRSRWWARTCRRVL